MVREDDWGSVGNLNTWLLSSDGPGPSNDAVRRKAGKRIVDGIFGESAVTQWGLIDGHRRPSRRYLSILQVGLLSRDAFPLT